MKRWSTTRRVLAFSALIPAGMLGCKDAVTTESTGPPSLSKDSAEFRARLASEGTGGIPVSLSHIGGNDIGVPIHAGESAVITITSSECASVGTVLTVSGALCGTISRDACNDAGASLAVGPTLADGLLSFTMTDPNFGTGSFKVSGSSPSFNVFVEDGFGDLDFNDAILSVVLGTFSDDDGFPPGGPAAFVINRGTGFVPARTVAVVDIVGRRIEQEIELCERPTSLAVTPDGSLLYVTVTGARRDPGKDAIAVISVPDRSLRQIISAGDGPWGIDITPDGQFAYVSHVFGANVGVLQLSDNRFIKTITSQFFDTPQGVAITPSGSHVYVANVAFLGFPGASPNVTVIETASNTVLDAVDLTGLFGPWDVVVTPDGNKAYANDGDSGEHVFEIDSDPLSPTFKRVTDILVGLVRPVGGFGPRGMESGLTPAGVRVYAALAQSDEVIAIDPASQEIVHRVATGSGSFPWRVRLNPDGTELWVSLRNSGEVLVLDTQTHGEIARISGFDRPADIAFAGSGAVPFDGFRIERARAKRDKKKVNRDRFDVRGRLAIGNAGDGIDALVGEVTVTFGQFSQTIPARFFVRKGKNLDKLEFKAPRGTPGIRRIEIRDDGRFSVKARDIDLSAIDFPGLVAFALQIGNDIGQAEIAFDEKGRFRFGLELASDVQDIIDDVSALVPDALTERQADRLIKKLEKAQEDLERGRTKGAVKQLESFIKSVLRLKDDGFILDEADFLVGDAQDLIDMVLDLQ